MSLELFLVSIVLTLSTVGAALFYLRSITRRVLAMQCGHDTGAEFWLRSADVLALAGSLILVLAFGGAAGGSDWVQQMRLVLGLALGGIFVTVVLVASNVWRALPETATSRATSAAARTAVGTGNAASASLTAAVNPMPGATPREAV